MKRFGDSWGLVHYYLKYDRFVAAALAAFRGLKRLRQNMSCYQKFSRRLLVVFILAVVLTACLPGTTPEPPLQPVAVQLAWTHSAQFAGFYAADQNGYYTDEGLAVSFIEGGPQVDRMSPVLTGTAQFGVASGLEIIEARVAGKPVRAVATLLQRDPFAFFALAESGITRPEDFAGKRIQIRSRSRPFLQAITAQVGLEPEQYIEDLEADYEDLYTEKVDVVVGFVTAQLIEAEAAGYQLNVIHPDDYGIHFYSNIIITTEAMIASDPELVMRFLRATIEGWRYAIEHPAEAGDLVAHYNPEADSGLENSKMAASLPLINTGEDHIGWMKPETWESMVTTLQQQAVLITPIDPAQLYTMEFLQEIYGNP